MTTTNTSVRVATNGSDRWIIAEDLAFFGGRLRDMYEPECAGHPSSRFSDNYACLLAEEDFGGVHINSGLVNKTFTLLADGGSLNGVTVTGIGLDKSAHIFYQTMAYYLHPTINFAELSRVLIDAAFDIKDVTLPALTVAPAPASAPDVTLSIHDISQLINAITATGLGNVSPCDLLPVTYTYLEARAEGKQITLRWGTADEAENAGFAVERRHEDEQDFRALDFVAGGKTDYVFPDETAAPGTSYYRLRQRDFDGTEVISRMVSAKISATELLHWPNPATTTLHVRATVATGYARLFSLSGKQLAARRVVNFRAEIDISGLPEGIYLLKVKNELRRVIVSR